MNARTVARPPGPKGRFLSGNLPAYRLDPLGFLTRCARTYGGIVALRFGRRRFLLLTHPDYIEYVLNTGHRNFRKHSKGSFSPLLGQGLFASDGDFWLRQRRLAQPAFQRQRLAVHGKIIVALAERMLATWQDGETRDFHEEMMRLMLEITARTILGIDAPEEARDLGCALDAAVTCVEARFGSWGWLPTPNNLRLGRALRDLDTILYRLIERRRADGGNRDDVFSSLLHPRHGADDGCMTDRQARDEAVNLFVAGRETTALALSWTWYLLAHHPESVAELEAELDSVLGGRAPTVADLPQLRYIEQVVMESLRLFPPAFGLGRVAIQDCEIGGYRVPAGTSLLLSQWVVHRDPQYFDHPDQFRPHRWADGLAQRLPKYAYFPFGAGPRLCIGNTFAMMNTVLVLATIAQRFCVAPAPGHVVTLWPNVTLRPWQGIKVVLKANRRFQGSGVRRANTSVSVATRTRPRISLCMIVRNEVDNLSACLDSAAHLFDEIVVVDTGSTDDTKTVAASWGARVVDFVWCEDFAAARNESMRHATGDWIFWLDADERLDTDNQQRLRDLFAALKNENVAYVMRQLSRPHKVDLGVQVGMVRLFRNDLRLRWHYRVYEHLLPSLHQYGVEIRPTEITIEHLGYQDPNCVSAKLERNFHLLQLDDAEHPDNPYILFNLGFVCLDRGQPGETVRLLKRSLELAQPGDPFVRQLFRVLARAQSRLGRKAEALATLRTGREHFADDPELLFTEGVLLAEEGNFVEAGGRLEQLLRSQELSGLVRVDPGVRGYLGRHYLAGVYCAQGRLAEAEVEWKKSVEDWPNFTPAWRGLGELYAEHARWNDFANIIERMRANPPAQLDAAVLQAEGHLARKEFTAACETLGSVIAANPQALWPREVLSRALLGEGKDRAAIENALRAVLDVAPNHAEAQHNLALLLWQQRNGNGEPTPMQGNGALKASETERSAPASQCGLRIQESPSDGEDLSETNRNLAEAYFFLGFRFLQEAKLEQAVAAYRQGLRICPEAVPAWNGLGIALDQLGGHEEAAAAFRQALTLRPDDATIHIHLGDALVHHNKSDEARDSYRRALEISPDHYQAHGCLGALLEIEGKTDEAAHHFKAALAIQSTPNLRVRLATLLPPIYQSREEMRDTRQRLIGNLNRLRQEELHFDPTREPVNNNLFFLAYQGENDRDLQRALAQIYAQGLDPALPPSARSRSSGKIRVGFISRHLKDHTIGLLNRGLIASLSREHFSVIVLAVQCGLDLTAQFIRQHSDEYVVLPECVSVARRMIADLQLDVLFYTDIGMDEFTYTLAFSRLAPVQCVTWGHPMTTGIPTMDYFISSRLLEPDDAEDHYTETLVRLQGLPIYYYRPRLPSPQKDRSFFGLSDDHHLYACPQAPFKFHPEFDLLLGEILRRDPRGQLAMIRDKCSHWIELLKKRFATTIPDVVDRIRIVPPQSRPDFLNLLAVSDVLLDPVHFGGGNTSYEAFAVGAPIVSLPSAFLRGRITYALYQKMGVMDCVVSSRQAYVDRAVELGTNPSYRENVRRKILAANHVLYEDIAGIQELEEFFRAALNSAQTR